MAIKLLKEQSKDKWLDIGSGTGLFFVISDKFDFKTKDRCGVELNKNLYNFSKNKKYKIKTRFINKDIIVTVLNQIIDISKYDNLRIKSNEFVFDEEGTITDFKINVNSVGKKMILTNEKVGMRKNFIVLGDILADVNMVKNIDYDNLICIGYLNKPKDVSSSISFILY